METQARESRESSDDAIRIALATAKAARKAADAAEKSALAAMGVAVPTLMLNQFEFAPRAFLTLEQVLQSPPILISVKNFGQSPAILRSYAIEFTGEELPSELQYPSLICCDIGTVVEAGKALLLDEEGISPWKEFSADDAHAFAVGSKTLTVFGCVWYDDIFGSPTRTLTFCKWGAGFSEGES